MILAIDIGNTSTGIGVFDEISKELIHEFKLTSDKKRSSDEYGLLLHYYLSNFKILENINGAIISSVVVNLGECYKEAIKKFFNIDAILVNHKTKTNIKLRIDKPEEIGADRLVNGHYVSLKYKLPAIVVDFGTATTFDIVNKNAEFVGGIITAGVKLQAETLGNFTSKLPKLKIEAPKNTIGTNTIDAMLSGIVKGHANMIDGLLEQCEKELGEKATVIATGGYTSIVENQMKRKFDYIDLNLTLKGLLELYLIN